MSVSLLQRLTRPLRDLFLQLTRKGDADRVSVSIGFVDTGSAVDLTTPLEKRLGRERVFADLHQIATRNVDSRIVELETEEIENAGIRSIRLPWDKRRETVVPYWEPVDFAPDRRLFAEAIRQVGESYLQLGTLRPINIDLSVRKSPSNTNLGLPSLTRDKTRVIEYRDRAANLKDPEDVFPSFGWWRAKVVGLVKPIDPGRLVWGFDHAETYFSSRFLHPAIGVLRGMAEHAAWGGPEHVDDVVLNWIRPFALNRQGFHFISVDYSGFDTSVSREAIEAVFSIWEKQFPGHVQQLRLIKEIFATSGLVTPDGWITGRNKAVPSGTAVTNWFDGVWNRIIIRYSALKRRAEERHTVQGDDALIATNLRLEHLVEDSLELGMKVSDDKTLESQDTAHYLRRLYLMDKGTPGIYPMCRAASSLTGYERYDRDGWDQYHEALRNIMLVNNSEHHPRFEEEVQYLYENDRVLQSEDPVAVAKKAGNLDKAIRSLGRAFTGSGYENLKGCLLYTSPSPRDS